MRLTIARACSSGAEQGAHNLKVAGSNPARPTLVDQSSDERPSCGIRNTHLPEEVTIEAADLARRIADTASQEQATDILVLDIQHLSTITDYFVIASVDNVRQLRATAEAIDQDLKEHERIRASRREGNPDSGWVVLDYPGVLIHLMTVEQREFYRLESLWADAHRLLVIQ